MLVQVGLCWTCSETTLLVFPRGDSIVDGQIDAIVGRVEILTPISHPAISIKQKLSLSKQHVNNQRTNGPVNAHLRSASYTNKHI